MDTIGIDSLDEALEYLKDNLEENTTNDTTSWVVKGQAKVTIVSYLLATSGHVRNVNTMERLANRLTLAARHVKACVISERDTRKKHIYFVNNHEEIMENIYRSFRTTEKHQWSS